METDNGGWSDGKGGFAERGEVKTGRSWRVAGQSERVRRGVVGAETVKVGPDALLLLTERTRTVLAKVGGIWGRAPWSPVYVRETDEHLLLTERTRT